MFKTALYARITPAAILNGNWIGRCGWACFTRVSNIILIFKLHLSFTHCSLLIYLWQIEVFHLRYRASHARCVSLLEFDCRYRHCRQSSPELDATGYTLLQPEYSISLQLVSEIFSLACENPTKPFFVFPYFRFDFSSKQQHLWSITFRRVCLPFALNRAPLFVASQNQTFSWIRCSSRYLPYTVRRTNTIFDFTRKWLCSLRRLLRCQRCELCVCSCVVRMYVLQEWNLCIRMLCCYCCCYSLAGFGKRPQWYLL